MQGVMMHFDVKLFFIRDRVCPVLFRSEDLLEQNLLGMKMICVLLIYFGDLR